MLKSNFFTFVITIILVFSFVIPVHANTFTFNESGMKVTFKLGNIERVNDDLSINGTAKTDDMSDDEEWFIYGNYYRNYFKANDWRSFGAGDNLLPTLGAAGLLPKTDVENKPVPEPKPEPKPKPSNPPTKPVSSSGTNTSTSGTNSSGDSTSTTGTSSSGDNTSTSGTNSSGDSTSTSGTNSSGDNTSTSGTNSSGDSTSTSGTSSSGDSTSTSGLSSSEINEEKIDIELKDDEQKEDEVNKNNSTVEFSPDFVENLDEAFAKYNFQYITNQDVLTFMAGHYQDDDTKEYLYSTLRIEEAKEYYMLFTDNLILGETISNDVREALESQFGDDLIDDEKSGIFASIGKFFVGIFTFFKNLL
ncbi:hypothetical protein AB3N04_01245 (plasmid) [Alkalihalophilus sp. As8PL]|uniref:Uncharacterized protein n=1 Tax=Alkalihalophilus sp. As8PL TaxID=3237103 RepID=A0AB39BNQ5_9BACI